jgi:hypothetical protein
MRYKIGNKEGKGLDVVRKEETSLVEAASSNVQYNKDCQVLSPMSKYCGASVESTPEKAGAILFCDIKRHLKVWNICK